ncbi:ribonuclease H-like domain-containing protein [Baffinella frigidus]|nr:ribonuclease H-like domain-containing protein [Cryptophyta sp. CCMP2293]
MVLAFDIETLGVNKTRDLITVISLYDPVAGISRVLRFVDLNEACEVVYTDDYLDTVATLVEYLDNAEYLCGFNSVSFDIPFIQIQFKLSNDTVQNWVLKCHDVLEISRRGFGRTFNLNSCLALNGVGDGKTGSGLEAVHQAQRGAFKELEQYCADDARLTYELSVKSVIYCCEGYQYRKSHGDRTHDPACVLMIHTDKFPELSFSHGPMPGMV